MDTTVLEADPDLYDLIDPILKNDLAIVAGSDTEIDYFDYDDDSEGFGESLFDDSEPVIFKVYLQ